MMDRLCFLKNVSQFMTKSFFQYSWRQLSAAAVGEHFGKAEWSIPGQP